MTGPVLCSPAGSGPVTLASSPRQAVRKGSWFWWPTLHQREWTCFFDPLLVTADANPQENAALLRRQAIYLLGFEPRSSTADWLHTNNDESCVTPVAPITFRPGSPSGPLPSRGSDRVAGRSAARSSLAGWFGGAKTCAKAPNHGHRCGPLVPRRSADKADLGGRPPLRPTPGVGTAPHSGPRGRRRSPRRPPGVAGRPGRR